MIVLVRVGDPGGWVCIRAVRREDLVRSSSRRIRRCGPEHKRKARARIFDYRFLQVECFKRNVTPRAIEAEIFEITVCEPIVRHSMAGPLALQRLDAVTSRIDWLAELQTNLTKTT